jgi:hypothetical protein
VEIELFDYLNPGTNTVNLEFQGEHCKATRTIQVIITLVTMTLKAQFQYYNIFTNGSAYDFNVTLQSSTDTIKSIWYYIDADKVPVDQEPVAIALPLYDAGHADMKFSANEKNTTKRAYI